MAYQASAQVNVYTDPVGFITYTAVPNGYSFWGLGMTQIPALRGLIGTPATGQIPVNSTLTANQFTADGTAGHIGYFIEITSGANAGLTDDIVSNDTANVYTASDITSLIASGESFKIYPHWTPNTVMGPPSNCGLLGGSAPASADNVLVWNPVTQSSTTYYYRTNTNGAGPGWRGPQGSAVNAGTNVWYLDEGIQVLRISASGANPTNTMLVGGVKLGPTIVPMAGGPNGYTFASYVYATSTTFDGLNMSPTNTPPGVVGGSAPSSSDNVIVWNAAGQSSTTYYWRTNTNGAGPGWRGPQGSAVSAGTNSIPIGSIIQVLRLSAGPFNWVAQQPY
jgi:uncharacterized protein (TIGR02597 family)